MRPVLRNSLITLAAMPFVLTAPAIAQGPSRLFAGVSTNLAVVDTHHGEVRRRFGFQLSGDFGWRLSAEVSDFTLITLTALGQQYAPAPPCAYPGCGPLSAPSVTGLSVARGFRFTHTIRGREFALALAPGGLWLVQRPSGTRALSPMLAAQFQAALLGGGPHLRFTVGGQWWFANGAVPRWTLPLGLNLEFP